jgi:hypothetical protein
VVGVVVVWVAYQTERSKSSKRRLRAAGATTPHKRPVCVSFFLRRSFPSVFQKGAPVASLIY